MTPRDFWLTYDGRLRKLRASAGADRMTPDEFDDLRERVDSVVVEKGLER